MYVKIQSTDLVFKSLPIEVYSRRRLRLEISSIQFQLLMQKQ